MTVPTDPYVRDPMRLIEAEAWVIARLGATPRAEHSRFAGHLMRRLGERLAPEEAELWEITGLLHDLDYFIVDGDWHIHGRTTAAWLEGRLPLRAMLAIAAHDHRSGIVSDAPMSQALRLADALANLDQQAGRKETMAALNAGTPEAFVGERSYLAQMVVSLAASLGFALEALALILATLPEQGPG